MAFSRPKGTSDFFGEQILEWQAIEDIIRELCAGFLINEIRTPMYEYAELFRRGVGETTDIVQKEMFTFKDAGDRLFALRPEGTANVARAFIENGMASLPMPLKLYYIMPVFRAEKPQKGRFRQHHQFGVEYFGAAGPECEAEVISVASALLERIGIKGAVPHINSLGCKDCRAAYNAALKMFLGDNLEKLCPICRGRFEKNPLRVLDCKNAECAGLVANAPLSVDIMDEECGNHFEGVKRNLDLLGIDYIVSERLVRGLDYYTRTVFEFKSTDLGAQDSLLGGGRYDGLMKDCGGPDTAAVGFGMGLERLLIILEGQGVKLSDIDIRPVFAGFIGGRGRDEAVKLVQNLRKNGIPAEFDLLGRSVKAQMKYADKLGAAYAIVIGDGEIENDSVEVRDMRKGGSEVQSLSNLSEYFVRLYKEA
ncbi:MAG: histidine--tRNA ligase [Defluviitaleaceae bacterium]|nr:histidine--tRNA ligase [Defluviitaleaceae bacterium]MCL2835694.1 histidine--tRNA ligase [Defluviitaleaceae bacterium]